MIKAVIFDMDGVIVDSEPIESLAWEQVLIEYAREPIFNNEGLIHTVGISGEESYRSLIEKYHLENDIEIIRIKKRAKFKNLIMKEITPMKGFLRLINILKKQKLKIALASNRVTELVHPILENLGVKRHFEVIVGASPDIKHKPLPDLYLQCAKDLKITPKFCVAIEDSESGITSAKTAGMKVIAVPNQYTKTHDFSKADRIVESLSEISPALIHSL